MHAIWLCQAHAWADASLCVQLEQQAELGSKAGQPLQAGFPQMPTPTPSGQHTPHVDADFTRYPPLHVTAPTAPQLP